MENQLLKICFQLILSYIYTPIYTFLCNTVIMKPISYPNKRALVFLLTWYCVRKAKHTLSENNQQQRVLKSTPSCLTASESSPLKIKRQPTYLGSLGQNKEGVFFSQKITLFYFCKYIFLLFQNDVCGSLPTYLLIIPVANFDKQNFITYQFY